MSAVWHPKGCDCGGFDRNGSHAAGEYVGYCDHQKPDNAEATDDAVAHFRKRWPEAVQRFRADIYAVAAEMSDEIERLKKRIIELEANV